MDRLLALVQPEPMSGCWVWVGVKNPRGYGIYKASGRANRKAHRLIWAALRGPIPAGRQLHHRCQLRACVNPGHLEVVGAAEHRAKHVKAKCKWGHERVTRPSGRRVCPTCVRRWKRGGKSPGVRRRLQLRYADRVAQGRCTVCETPVLPGARMCETHLEAARQRHQRKSGHQPWRPGGPGRPPINRNQA